MNYSGIDIRETRKRKKVVVRKSWIEHILDFLTAVMYTFIYPVVVFSIVIRDLILGNDISSSLVLNIFLSLVVCGSLLYSYLNIGRFKKFQGKDFDTNKRATLEVIETNKWSLRRKTKTMLIASPKLEFFSLNWGRQYNILLDKDDLYINVTSFGIFDLVSPFHWFADRWKEKEIIKEIRQNF